MMQRRQLGQATPTSEQPALGGSGAALGWQPIVLIVLVSRVAYGVVGILASQQGLRPLANPDPAHIPGVLVALLAPWQQWDVGWYITIAGQGYGATIGATAFQPLYPLLIHLLTPLCGGAPLVAALVISTVAYATSLWLLIRVVAPRLGLPLANGALAFLLVAPAAVFFFSGYTESLYLALTLAVFFLADRKMWLMAGICAALACLTRVQGLALLPALLVVALSTPGPRTRLRSGLALLGPPLLAVAGYQSLITYVWRLPSSPAALRQGWGISPRAPWTTLLEYLNFLRCPQCYIVVAWTADCLLAFAALALVLAGLRRIPLAWTVYAAVSLCIALTHMRGTSRYVAVIFPCYVVLAQLLDQRPRLRRIVFTLSTLLLVVLTYQYFVGWFVG